MFEKWHETMDGIKMRLKVLSYVYRKDSLSRKIDFFEDAFDFNCEKEIFFHEQM